MAARYLLSALFILLAVFFMIWARKLWHGEWLHSISGNAFASKKELELPYQKKMARETSLLVALLALLFVVLAYNELVGMSMTILLALSIAILVTCIVGSVVIATRANKAARTDQVEAGLDAMGWPTKDRNLKPGEKKAILVVQWFCFGFVALLPIAVILAAHLLGLTD